MSFNHHRFDPFFHSPSSSLLSPPFPFPLLPSPHSFDPLSSDLDLFAPPPEFDHLPLSSCPYYNPASLDLLDLSDRVASLELGAFRHCPAFGREKKHTWTTEIKGDRKYKWIAESKSNGERSYQYEAEIRSPWEDGFDRKYKWKAESDGNVKWTKEIKGKGSHEAWAHKYTCEQSLYGEGWKKYHGRGKIEEKKEEKKDEKKKHSVKVVEIEDSSFARDAIRKVQVFRCSGITIRFVSTCLLMTFHPCN